MVKNQRAEQFRRGRRPGRIPYDPARARQMHKPDLAHKSYIARKRRPGNPRQNYVYLKAAAPTAPIGQAKCREKAWEAAAAAGQTECQEKIREAAPPEKSKKKKAALTIIACIMLLLTAAGGYAYHELPYHCVKKDVSIEAGEACPSIEAFLEWECESAFIVSGIYEDMEFDHVQDYEVVIHLYHQNVSTMLHVIDTVPPKIQTRDKTIMLGEAFELEDFVESISDATACEAAYKEEPDVQSRGSYVIVLEVKDEGGNITEGEAHLEVLEDVTPPVIEGVEEITITEGESVSYKRNVTVTDDYDDAVQLVVDNSQVDVNTPGDYTVVYHAADKYGNEAEIATILHVIKKRTPQQPVEGVPMTEEAVNAEADKILASITNPSMSQYEIIKAIYDWTHTKIAYSDGTLKTDWVEGAYAGLVARKGDCFAFAMTSKCLLNRAGITNMDIERVRVGNSMHFWNLVDIGEGWHHFDTCRRGDGAAFFYLTDAELMAYSENHKTAGYPNGSHYYDRTLYPEIP